MNHSLIIRTGALASAVALAGAVAIPTTAGAARSSDHARPRLTLVDTTDAFHLIDAPAPVADGQAGDTITFESTLRTKAGAKKGTLEGHCLQIRADGSLDDCDVTLGTTSYRMAGPFDPTTGGTLTITGGTGSLVGAGGTDKIVNQPDGTAIHTITLTRR